MNGCDYNHLIKGNAWDHYSLCAVSYPATETAECAFLNVSWCSFFSFSFFNIIAMFAIDIISI